MTERRYEPHEIESRWQHLWARERTWEVSNDVDPSSKLYVLEMLPTRAASPTSGT